MKKFLFAIIISISLWCVGCNKESSYDITTPTQYENAQTTTGVTDSTSETSTTKEQDDTQNPDNELIESKLIEKYGVNDAERLGVDKTLVWIMARQEMPSSSAISELNDLLVNEYGCDFVVEFHCYEVIMDHLDKNYTYSDMVLDMKALGFHADILYSGNFFDYDLFINEDIYMPLTDYFATSDDGRKLYDAYAPKVWELTKRDGVSYGYISRIYPESYALALCNEEVAKKYGITVPSGEWSFYDIGEYLKAADVTKNKMSDGELLICCSSDALLLMEGYQTFDTFGKGVFWKKNGDNGWTAVNPAEETDFIKLLQTIKEYKDKGWYVNSTDQGVAMTLDENGKKVYTYEMGNFVFMFEYFVGTGIFYDNNKYIGSRSTRIITDNILQGKGAYAAYETQSNMINGITSWSEYKDEALKLLALINTEATISNLLEFGTEDEDYTYENRILTSLVENKEIDMPTLTSSIANMNLLHSVLVDPDDKLAYSKEISANYVTAPTMIYDFDMSEYAKQIQEISDIYSKYSEAFFMGNYDDVEAAVTEMGKELAAAGIDEIIDAINKQMQ